MLRLLVAIGLLFCIGSAQAQQGYNCSTPQCGQIPYVSTVNGNSGIVTVQPGNFIGNYTVSTLLSTKPCDGSTVAYGSVAYVTDLGGGGNNVKCIANAWQHFTLGTPATNSSTTTQTITWTPLVSAPIIQMTGTIALANTITLQIQTTNLYPGYVGCVISPPSILGSLLVGVLGTGITLPILGGTRSCYVWNGTTLLQFSS